MFLPLPQLWFLDKGLACEMDAHVCNIYIDSLCRSLVQSSTIMCFCFYLYKLFHFC
ncbi:hypothetical protein Hanom_Chr12g01073571 [Helianthus anomalus]